jgi:hypothetical protein
MEAVERLFGWCRMSDDVGNRRLFLAGAVAIVAGYSEEVAEKLSDPRTGTRAIRDYPALSDIRKACDLIFEPINRESERQEAHNSHVAGLLQKPPRTPEQQARIDTQVARARQEIANAQIASGAGPPFT